MSKKIAIGILVLAFQAATVGSVCATPKTHPCCKETACTTVLTCCTPSPVKGAAPQAGIQSQQNFSNVVIVSAVPETPAVLLVAILDRVLSVHSPPLFLNKSSLLL